jgi:hypothetical protein
MGVFVYSVCPDRLSIFVYRVRRGAFLLMPGVWIFIERRFARHQLFEILAAQAGLTAGAAPAVVSERLRVTARRLSIPSLRLLAPAGLHRAQRLALGAGQALMAEPAARGVFKPLSPGGDSLEVSPPAGLSPQHLALQRHP